MGPIIGVVEDFHFRPMTAAIEPLVFSYMPSCYYSGIMVRAGPNQIRESIALIKQRYKKYEVTAPVHYNFVDQQLEDQYRFEQGQARSCSFFLCWPSLWHAWDCTVLLHSTLKDGRKRLELEKWWVHRWWMLARCFRETVSTSSYLVLSLLRQWVISWCAFG